MSIKVDFLASGVPELERAFRTVAQYVADLERRTTNITQQQASVRVRAAERSAREQSRAAETSATYGVRATQVASEQELQIRNRATRARLQLLDQETRGVIRGLEEQRRAYERHTEAVRRSQRVGQQQLRAATGTGGRGGGMPNLGGGVQGALSTFGLPTSLAGLAGMGIGMMGGFSVAKAISAENNLQKSAIMLSNATYIPELDMGKGVKTPATPRAAPKQVMDFAKKASIETGTDTTELIDAWQTYIERSSDSRAFTSSDPKERKEAQDMLVAMAKVAKGSGSNLKDVMNAAGFLRVQNESMSSDDMKTTMLNVIGQGKLGAISLSDLASNISTITAQSGGFAMGTTKAQRSLMGLAQIAVQTAGTAPEAATTVSRFVAETGEAGKAQKLANIGVKVRDKTGGMKDPAEILRDLFKATGGKTEKMDAIYDVRSMRLMNALRTTYNEGVQNELASRALAKERGEKRKDIDEATAGSEAVFKKVTRFERMGYAEGDALKDFENVMSGRSEQIDQAAREVSAAFQQLLAPAAGVLSAAFTDAAKGIAGFIKENLVSKDTDKERNEAFAAWANNMYGLQMKRDENGKITESPEQFRDRVAAELKLREGQLDTAKGNLTEDGKLASWTDTLGVLGTMFIPGEKAAEIGQIKVDQYKQEIDQLTSTTQTLREQLDGLNKHISKATSQGVNRTAPGLEDRSVPMSVDPNAQHSSIVKRGGAP